MIPKEHTAVAEMPGPTAQLLSMFSRYRFAVEEEMRSAMPNDPRNLYTLLGYHMGWMDTDGAPSSTAASQGKSLRPTLCMFSCEALSGASEMALAPAAAVEYVHNFSLIHDDIQDGDEERRHRPTVWAVWGQPRALVAGDTMLSLADAIMHRLYQRGVSRETALQTSALLMQGYLEMIQGQCLDLSFEGNLHIRLDDYLRMISLKTGSLIRCSMAIGALLGSGEQRTVEAFARCGALLGQAFQARDDTLGIWGEQAATGKAVGADIRRKKTSFPLVYALEHAKGANHDTLIHIFSKEHLDEADVGDVLGILDEVGAQQYAYAFTCDSANKSVKQLASVSMPTWAKKEFRELVDFLTSRQY